jgi:hypothetical protein
MQALFGAHAEALVGPKHKNHLVHVSVVDTKVVGLRGRPCEASSAAAALPQAGLEQIRGAAATLGMEKARVGRTLCRCNAEVDSIKADAKDRSE